MDVTAQIGSNIIASLFLIPFGPSAGLLMCAWVGAHPSTISSPIPLIQILVPSNTILKDALRPSAVMAGTEAVEETNPDIHQMDGTICFKT